MAYLLHHVPQVLSESFNGTLDSERIVEEDRKPRKGGTQSEADRVTESPVTAPVTGGKVCWLQVGHKTF